MSKQIAFFCLIIFVAISCAKKDSPDPVQNTDRAAVLTNIGNNIIITSFTNFETSAKVLKQKADSYAGDISSEQKLTDLQAAWLSAAVAWKQASIFSQGPVEQDFLATGIYYNSVNTSGIEKSIAQTTTTINNAYIETLGAGYKGLPSLEYLLFGAGSSNSALLAAFKSNPQRAVYLSALSENLQKQASKVLSEWNAGGDNYIAKFTTADGRDINSSLGMLSNKMIDLIYTIKDERVGAPKGTRNNGTPQPDLVDGKYSNQSLALMTAELQGLESAFTGQKTGGSGTGQGIDDILDKSGAKSGTEMLSAKIKTQFATVYTRIGAISVPLSQAVTTNKTEVSSLYDEVKKIQVLLEVDMINNLGVLLTFSDNDGD